MLKYEFADIVARPIDIDVLEVQSFEMNIYLVQLTVQGKTGMVYENDRPKRFHNSNQIRELFVDCRVSQSFMVHDSPYDEMIGNPPKSAEQMALPFSMTQPY